MSGCIIMRRVCSSEMSETSIVGHEALFDLSVSPAVEAAAAAAADSLMEATHPGVTAG